MILVDHPIWPNHGRMWAHVVSDHSYDELHDFAKELGIPVRAFDCDHYDIPEELVPRALSMGAVQVGSKELLLRMTAAGLRRPKGRQSR